MADPRFAWLDGRGVLAVSGPDRRSLLQGLVSNDVEKIGATQGGYGALLTAQGRYLHDFFMIEVGDAIWLDTEAARLPELKRRLSIYRLRAKVSLDEMSDLAVAALFGAGALAALGLADSRGAAQRLDGGIAFVDPRLAALGARAILPRRAEPEALASTGFEAADFAAYDRLRLGLGVPDGSRDLVPEKSLLLESGFDELNGVDWQKGCYIGQELTARTKYRGLVKRRLMPVECDGPAPAAGTMLTADGRDAGEMRSSRDRLGLAFLRLEPVLEGKKVTAGNVTLAPRQPAWMRLDPAAD